MLQEKIPFDDSAFCSSSHSSTAVRDMVENILSKCDTADTGRVRSLNTSVRERSAEQTLKRIAPVLHQFGVSALVDLTIADVPSCPVFQVVREDMRSAFLNAGKGYTAVESMVSGLMEAIEVCCFERADDRITQLSSEIAAAERGLKLVPTAALLGVAQSEPAPWPASATRLVKGRDLSNKEDVWLDARDVFHTTDATQPNASTANGIASGNSVPEALCHAIGEILERHALAGYTGEGSQGNIRLYQQHERVCAPTDSVYINACLAELRAKHIDPEFLLIARDAGVFVFICSLSVPIHACAKRAAVQGFGAHPDASIAMARALAEAVQMLALCPVEGIEGQESAAQARTVLTSKQLAELDPSILLGHRIATHTWLEQLRRTLPTIDFDFLEANDAPVAGGVESTEAALQRLVDGLASMHCAPIYYCVISPPELPVVVVKCFCPGLYCIANL